MSVLIDTCGRRPGFASRFVLSLIYAITLFAVSILASRLFFKYVNGDVKQDAPKNKLMLSMICYKINRIEMYKNKTKNALTHCS